MVSDIREISLISSIKSTLNNISHTEFVFIINSLRRQGKNQRGVLGRSLTPGGSRVDSLWKSAKMGLGVGFEQFTVLIAQ